MSGGSAAQTGQRFHLTWCGRTAEPFHPFKGKLGTHSLSLYCNSRQYWSFQMPASINVNAWKCLCTGVLCLCGDVTLRMGIKGSSLWIKERAHLSMWCRMSHRAWIIHTPYSSHMFLLCFFYSCAVCPPPPCIVCISMSVTHQTQAVCRFQGEEADDDDIYNVLSTLKRLTAFHK